MRSKSLPARGKSTCRSSHFRSIDTMQPSPKWPHTFTGINPKLPNLKARPPSPSEPPSPSPPQPSLSLVPSTKVPHRKQVARKSTRRSHRPLPPSSSSSSSTSSAIDSRNPIYSCPTFAPPIQSFVPQLSPAPVQGPPSSSAKSFMPPSSILEPPPPIPPMPFTALPPATHSSSSTSPLTPPSPAPVVAHSPHGDGF